MMLKLRKSLCKLSLHHGRLQRSTSYSPQGTQEIPERSIYDLAPSEMATFAVTTMQMLSVRGPRHLLIIPKGGNIRFTPKEVEVRVDPQEGGIRRTGNFNLELATWTPPIEPQNYGDIKQSRMWNKARVKTCPFGPQPTTGGICWNLEQVICTNLWTVQSVLETYLEKAFHIGRRRLKRRRDVAWLVCLQGMVAVLETFRSSGVCEHTLSHCYIVLNKLRLQVQECWIR